MAETSGQYGSPPRWGQSVKALAYTVAVPAVLVEGIGKPKMKVDSPGITMLLNETTPKVALETSKAFTVINAISGSRDVLFKTALKYPITPTLKEVTG